MQQSSLSWVCLLLLVLAPGCSKKSEKQGESTGPSERKLPISATSLIGLLEEEHRTLEKAAKEVKAKKGASKKYHRLMDKILRIKKRVHAIVKKRWPDSYQLDAELVRANSAVELRRVGIAWIGKTISFPGKASYAKKTSRKDEQAALPGGAGFVQEMHRIGRGTRRVKVLYSSADKSRALQDGKRYLVTAKILKLPKDLDDSIYVSLVRSKILK